MASRRRSSHHRPEHSSSARQHQTHGHHREEKEDETEEGGKQSTPAPPLLVRFHFLRQQLGSGYVQGEVRFRTAARLKQNTIELRNDSLLNKHSASRYLERQHKTFIRRSFHTVTSPLFNQIQPLRYVCLCEYAPQLTRSSSFV